MRWLAAWALYLAGDLLWRTCALSPWPTEHEPAYPLYNRLMTLSERIQGPSGHGPWERISS